MSPTDEIRFHHVKQQLRGSKPYDSEQMRQDWEAAIAVAALLADKETEWRHRLLDRYMTRIRAGLELGVKL